MCMCCLQQKTSRQASEEEIKVVDDKDQKAEGDKSDLNSQVIVSNSKRFIVKKVDDHQLQDTRIAEDEEEEISTSPDNVPSTAAQFIGPTDADEQRSFKSVTRPAVPINITDLQDKLSRLHTGQKSVAMAPPAGSTEGAITSSITPTNPQLEQLGQVQQVGGQMTPQQSQQSSQSQQYQAQPPGQVGQQQSLPVTPQMGQQGQLLQQPLQQQPPAGQLVAQQQLPPEQQAQMLNQQSQLQVSAQQFQQPQPLQQGGQLPQSIPVSQQQPQSIQQPTQQQPVQHLSHQQPQVQQQPLQTSLQQQQQQQQLSQQMNQQPQSVQMPQQQAQSVQMPHQPPQSVHQMTQHQLQQMGQAGQMLEQPTQMVQQGVQQQPQVVQPVHQQQTVAGQQTGQQQTQVFQPQHPQQVMQMAQSSGQQQPQPVQQLNQPQQASQTQPQGAGSQQVGYESSQGQYHGEVSGGQPSGLQIPHGAGPPPQDGSSQTKSLPDMGQSHAPHGLPGTLHQQQQFILAMQHMFPQMMASMQFPHYYPGSQFQHMQQFWHMYMLYSQLMQPQQHHPHGQHYQPHHSQHFSAPVAQVGQLSGSAMNPTQSSGSGTHTPMPVMSPPNSPPQVRRGMYEEVASPETSMDSAGMMGGQGSKSKAELSNLVNLEQALIKTIHGNRRETLTLVTPMPVVQPGTSTLPPDAMAQSSDIPYQSDSDSSVGKGWAPTAETKLGPTSSKSEPILHHGMYTVRPVAPVEAVAPPAVDSTKAEVVSEEHNKSSGSKAPSDGVTTGATRIKGRFKVTTTRDSKCQLQAPETDPTSSTEMKQTEEDVTNSAASASVHVPHGTTSASSANQEAGLQSLPKQMPHVSTRVCVQVVDPSGRLVSHEPDPQILRSRTRASSFNTLDGPESSLLRKRSASLNHLPSIKSCNNDQLYMYGDGLHASMLTKARQANAVMQSRLQRWGQWPAAEQADTASQTSPSLHKDRGVFPSVGGFYTMVSSHWKSNNAQSCNVGRR